MNILLKKLSLLCLQASQLKEIWILRFFLLNFYEEMRKIQLKYPRIFNNFHHFEIIFPSSSNCGNFWKEFWSFNHYSFVPKRLNPPISRVTSSTNFHEYQKSSNTNPLHSIHSSKKSIQHDINVLGKIFLGIHQGKPAQKMFREMNRSKKERKQ